jgi:hypothetical protein
MSDEVISIQEVIAYSLDTFPGLIEDRNWGERSLFYNPDRQLPKGTYFLTFKERDGANDSASRIRPGDYRLNVGISKVAFTNRFGAVPARPAAGGVVQTGHNFSQPDRAPSDLRVDVLDRDPKPDPRNLRGGQAALERGIREGCREVQLPDGAA